MITPNACPTGEKYFYDDCQGSVDPFWVNNTFIQFTTDHYRVTLPPLGQERSGFISKLSMTDVNGFASTAYISLSLPNYFSYSGGAETITLFSNLDQDPIIGTYTGFTIEVVISGGHSPTLNVYARFYKSSVLQYSFALSPDPDTYDDGSDGFYFFEGTYLLEAIETAGVVKFYVDSVLKYTSAATTFSPNAYVQLWVSRISGQKLLSAYLYDYRLLETSQAGVCAGIYDTFPLTGVEILYPIIPSPVINVEVHGIDNKQYDRVIKSSVNQTYGTLKLRVDDTNMPLILAFIKSHKAIPVVLNTPSVYPFGNNYTVSNVYCLGYPNYSREKENYFRIDITFLQIVGVS